MRLLGINGIRTHGAGSTDQLLAELALRDWQTVDANYPLRHIWQVRSRRRQYADAQRLLRYHRDGDAVVAHSYGCLVSLRMMELGARFSTLFWFRPAMNRDYLIPRHACRRLYAIHDPRDRAIGLGICMPWHDFGAAGRYGLLAGNNGCGRIGDPRVTNIRVPGYIRHEPWHHSDDFLDGNRRHWVDFIDDRLT